MTKEPRKRHDPRRVATREALIQAAESMIARSGPDAVSLRQIGVAVGSQNNNVVAYHFGSKEALIEAVYRYRLAAIDERRAELLRELEAAGKQAELGSLMQALWQPLFEQTDASGEHSYARFLGSMVRAGQAQSRQFLAEDFPQTSALISLIDAQLPPQAAMLRRQRWPVILGIIVDTLLNIDLERLGTGPEGKARFDDGVMMATAALLAPPVSCESSV